MSLLIWLGVVFVVGVWAYRQGYGKGFEQGRTMPDDPPRDPYGVELGRIRTVEGMREAAAHTCRVIAREAANKARLSNEAAHNYQLTDDERESAVNKQKAWLYTCEAAERCEREIRALGLR